MDLLKEVDNMLSRSYMMDSAETMKVVAIMLQETLKKSIWDDIHTQDPDVVKDFAERISEIMMYASMMLNKCADRTEKDYHALKRQIADTIRRSEYSAEGGD